ncbi:MAG: UPF0175 family protein [Lachnospiraceae bacterium]|nr:UPF0175 family protein [Lachnospiraceae bacterium]
MSQITFTIPDEILFDTQMSDSEALDFAKKAVALHYYTKKGVSLGYCAQIAGMTKGRFIRVLAKNGVSVFRYDTDSELSEDVKNA